MQNFFPDGRQDRDDTLFIALAADFECGIVAREIVAVDTYEFRKPQSATVKQENDERISDKFEFRTFALPVQFVENPLHACRGNECRDSPGGFQCVDAVHDLFVDSPRTVEVTEETPQGGELPVHRGGSQMFCFRTVHDPFADVFHGDSPGIEIRFRNIEPLKEVCHVTAVILHRQWGKAADRR